MDWITYTIMTILLCISALWQMYTLGRRKGYKEGWDNCQNTIMFMIEVKEKKDELGIDKGDKDNG